MARLDPHSHADLEQPRPRHLKLRLSVDFESRQIAGVAALELATPAAGTLDLDSRALEVLEVAADSGTEVPFEVGPDQPILGRRVRLALPEGTREVRLRYRSSSDAPALQWLSPEQTEGGSHPFLFSQCQPIHARSLAPLPDTPRNRLTYEAEVEVARPLAAVMSAEAVGEEAGRRPGTRLFRFRMPQPIPPYLLALAVGRLESRELGPRSRVFAEPETVEAAAHEFADTEAMIASAEALFGPYAWDRYDLLVLPPSFPYGGMENPRMTFLTPTLLAGDRSLVDVVAHELAHSWTGNLVTNADMVALLEQAAGRSRFDRFMREYIARFRFTSITTEEFLAFLDDRLPGLAAQVGARDWLYEPGLPENAPAFPSPRLDGLVALGAAFARGERPAPAVIAEWSPAETLVYLQNLPREIGEAGCAWLDGALGLTGRGNHEILVEWLTIAAGSDYEPAFSRLRAVLMRVGRMKYLRPLYGALGRHPRTRALARQVFETAAPRYHPLSRRVAASLIEKYPDSPPA